MQQFYYLPDLLRIFDCSEKAVRAWVKIGRLPPPEPYPGRRLRWLKSSIDAYLAGLAPAAAEEATDVA